MLILLPPSETKRDGGDLPPLDLGALSFPSLGSARRKALAALATVSRSRKASADALKLGPTQAHEVERNRAVRMSPTMPVIDRYTGVLFDALSASSLTPAERVFAGEVLVVHSALFGLVGALDPIPAYRFSHDSRPPGLSLKRHWAPFVSVVLASRSDLVLDLRSEGYLALGPGGGENQHYVRVINAEGGRPLNHFNKHAKGELARALIRHGQQLRTATDVVDWAGSAGFAMSLGERNELVFAV